MGKIIEAGELPDSEKVYLKKDFLGWRVVEPIIYPDSRKFIWKNFFNKKGFVILLFLLLLGGLGYLAFKESINNYKEVMTNPCAYCTSCQEQTRKVIANLPSNPFQDINLEGLMFNASKE